MADVTPADDEVIAPEVVEGKPEVSEEEKPEVEGEKEIPEVEEPEKEPDFEEKDVPIRKSIQGHIIDRQKRTIEKLRSKQEEEEEIEEEVSTDDDVARLIDKKLAPIIETLGGRVDEEELNGLLAKHDDAKKYENRIKVYMRHPSYKGVPVEVIYHHLAFQETQKASAKKKQVADIEADEMRTPGRSVRKTVKSSKLPSVDELDDMSEDDFQKLQDNVLQGKF